MEKVSCDGRYINHVTGVKIGFIRYNWRDVLFDVTWSELHEPVLVVGSGDGNVIIFDQSRPPEASNYRQP